MPRLFQIVAEKREAADRIVFEERSSGVNSSPTTPTMVGRDFLSATPCPSILSYFEEECFL
jgi:hypothetical protein